VLTFSLFSLKKLLGIRLFDFDTCLLNNKTGVFCHGQSPARALGGELDPTFKVILDFMNSNPNEVITMEFGDTDGDPQILSNYIQSKLAQYFVNQTTGHSMMYSMSDPNNPWITLREMINNNTRIVVFFGRIYNVCGTNTFVSGSKRQFKRTNSRRRLKYLLCINNFVLFIAICVYKNSIFLMWFNICVCICVFINNFRLLCNKHSTKQD
jgi:hypothetical protein